MGGVFLHVAVVRFPFKDGLSSVTQVVSPFEGSPKKAEFGTLQNLVNEMVGVCSSTKS